MKYLTLKEAGELLGGVISFKALEARVKRGTVPSIKSSKGRRMVPEDVILAIKGGEQIETLSDRSLRILEGNASDSERMEVELNDVRSELKKARNIIKKYEQQNLKQEYFYNNLLEIVENNRFRPNIKVLETKRVTNPHEMLLLMSDAHYGEVVDPEAMFGVVYNTSVAKKRMYDIRDKVLRYKALREGAYPVQKLTVACIGDMLSGAIHEEITVSNESPVSQQWAEMGNLIAEVILAFCQEFPSVDLIVMPGNHCRMSKHPNFKAKWDNLEYMMGLYIHALLKDVPNLEVHAPKDIIYTHNILGHAIGLTHGDGFKSNSFGGIPFYGIQQKRAAFQAARKELGFDSIDMLMFGHFHQTLYWPGKGCDIVMNGSIKGPDEYAFVNHHAAEPPQQTLLTLNAKHGITALELIDLGHIGRI